MLAPTVPLTTLIAALAVLAVHVAIVNGGSLLPSPSLSSQKSPCSGSGASGATGRGGNCVLHCALGARLCRVCCLGMSLAGAAPAAPAGTTKRPDGGDGGSDGPTSTEASASSGSTTDDDGMDGGLTFPSNLPEGTENAMLETAAHIMSIVSGEDSDRIRTWVENPEQNIDNLNRLADKLSSFPRAPYGTAYWRLVLRSSKDRPFTLLREALAVRSVYLQSGAAGTTNPAPAGRPGQSPAGGSGGSNGDAGTSGAAGRRRRVDKGETRR